MLGYVPNSIIWEARLGCAQVKERLETKSRQVERDDLSTDVCVQYLYGPRMRPALECLMEKPSEQKASKRKPRMGIQ